MPFFSIILPTYNRAHFLPKAIESILAQTFKDWELIIVDDGSTDNTKEVVTGYTDPRIKYIYQENQERSAARNNGIAQAHGEYICFLDSDDYFLPEKLNTYYQALPATISKNAILYDGLIFENGNEQTKSHIPVHTGETSSFEFLLLHPIGPLQVCLPAALLKTERFNPNLRIGEDVELWLRLAKYCVFIPLDSFQTVALEHEDRSVNLKKYNAAKEQLKQLDLIFNMYSNEQLSDKVRKKMRSDCYFNSAKHFMMNGRKWKAISEIVRSASTDFQNSQFKHRMYCLFKLLLGEIPLEYKN
jgi:glycosyltransferase involved in cell wall biosynthesis